MWMPPHPNHSKDDGVGLAPKIASTSACDIPSWMQSKFALATPEADGIMAGASAPRQVMTPTSASHRILVIVHPPQCRGIVARESPRSQWGFGAALLPRIVVAAFARMRVSFRRPCPRLLADAATKLTYRPRA